jgi:hypothetical protein
MFSFDVKIVKFENPTEVWFQVLVIKYFIGIPYSKTYHSTGYGEHTKSVKYYTYESAKNSKFKIYNMLRLKYNTKTTKTVLD